GVKRSVSGGQFDRLVEDDTGRRLWGKQQFVRSQTEDVAINWRHACQTPVLCRLGDVPIDRLGVCHGAIEQSEAERLCRRVVQSLVDKPLDAVARSARVEVTLIEQLERHLAGAGARVHDSGGWVVRWFGRSPARSSDRSCMHFGAQVHPTTEPGWRPAAPGSHRACPGRYGFLHKKGLAERLAPTGLAPVERGL